jgi:tetratricopeptide (TPR) repeat protein
MAQRLKPDYYDAVFLMWKIYYKEGRYNVGCALGQKLIGIDPKRAVSFLAYAGSLNSVEEWERAAKAAQRAIELNPMFPAAHVELGIAYGSLENYDSSSTP